MAFTKIVSPGIDTTGSYTVQELNTVGVVTAATVQIGAATTVHTTGIDLGSGNITSHNINSTGSITAASFVGPVTGNITGDITATSGTFSGNVSIAGTLTYEDVTNIDSVGVITARSDVSIADKIIHTGDTNTALRFPADDTVTVETGGSERLRIHSHGQLELKVPDANAALKITPSGTNAPATIDFNTPGTGSAVFKVQGSEKVRITSAGLVGIGTNNPDQILTVRAGSTPQILLKPTDATPALFVGDTIRTGAGQHLAEYRGNWDGTTVGRMVIVAGDDTTNKDNGEITFNTATAGSTIERLRITSNGMLIANNTTQITGFVNPSSGSGLELGYDGTRGVIQCYDRSTSTAKNLYLGDGDVGIGDNAPNRKLVISQANSTAYSGTDFDQDYHVLKLNNTTDSKTVGMQFLIGSNGEAAITATESSDGATDLVFGTRGSGSRAERLRINSDGTIRLKSDGTAANKARFEINEKWNNNATDFGIDFKRTYDVGGDDQDAGFIHVKRNGGSSQIGMSFGIGNKDDVSERACLTSAGDLGIGVTPDADRRLHVKDVNAVVKIEGTTSYAQVEFKTGSTSSAWIWRNQQSVTSYGGASSLNFYQTENAGFAFFTNAVSSPAMLIAGNGMVTKPKNPSFAVTRNVSTWSMSTNTIFDYNTKIHDVGNNFSLSTYKFTCPVAGTYQFNFYSIYYATALANAAVYIRKNNTRISGGDQHFSVDFSTARWHNVSYSISLLCAANDTVHVENGSVGVTYHGGFWHRFSGHLIG